MVRTILRTAGAAVGVLGVFAIGGAGVILLFQAYGWLSTGAWLPMPLGAAVVAVWRDIPQSGSVGADQLLQMVWSLPLSGSLFVLGSGGSVLGMRIQAGAG